MQNHFSRAIAGCALAIVGLAVRQCPASGSGQYRGRQSNLHFHSAGNRP